MWNEQRHLLVKFPTAFTALPLTWEIWDHARTYYFEKIFEMNPSLRGFAHFLFKWQIYLNMASTNTWSNNANTKLLNGSIGWRTTMPLVVILETILKNFCMQLSSFCLLKNHSTPILSIKMIFSSKVLLIPNVKDIMG